jgi:pimeloyl-ACP methyl ester carboxylesterase
MKKLLLILLVLPLIGFSQTMQTYHSVTSNSDSLLTKQEAKERLYKKSDKNVTVPYPIIFIHGLSGDWESWYDFDLYSVGWSFGGYLDFCLNSCDAYSMQDYCNLSCDINDLTSPLSNADYYVIDFDCEINSCTGSGSSVRSNKAAIILGGRALGMAIDNVLNVTGKEKVILMGHSMGGLNAREYLQDSSHWIGSTHRVAKLVTSGTPHGGSNVSFAGFGVEWSEAIRDLRRSYYAGSGLPGAYLYGGMYENHSNINNGSNPPFTNYYNVNINCDGDELDLVVGLNTKELPDNLDFSFIVSDYFNNGSDGVVGPYYADLSNYYTNISHSELFDASSYVHSSTFSQLGTIPTLTEADYINFKAIDEPDYIDLSYKVSNGILYTGYLTYQEVNHNYLSWGTDCDFYHFYLNDPSNISIIVNNLNANGQLNLYDDSYSLLQNVLSNSAGHASIQNQFPAGKYYFSITASSYGDPANGSSPPWENPYTFLIWDDPVGINELDFSQKKLLKVIDLLGRETKGTKNEVLFYIYNDGTVEKRIIIE